MAGGTRDVSDDDGQDSGVVLSATAQHIALGGSGQAPRQLRDGCRWLGGGTSRIEGDLIKQCAEGSEAGKVTDLNFHFKFLQEISGLQQYAPNLRMLDLSSNNIAEIQGLTGMMKLRELKLYSCQISRIQNLEPCRNLSALNLEDNRIGAIEGLDALGALEYLNLDKNKIQRIGKGLTKLNKLKELHLCHNRVAVIENIQGLSLLEVLRLNQNQISNVPADQMRPLGKLDELHLAGNQLSSLAFLGAAPKQTSDKSMPATARQSPQCLSQLATLDVSGNQLSGMVLESLPTLMQLTELNLAGNQISDLPTSFSTSCPSLEILDLTGNQLERPESLQQLAPLSSIRELLIQGNPAAADREGVRTALAGLAGLEYVDDRPVSPPPTEPEMGEQDVETFTLTKTDALEERRKSAQAGSRPATGSSRPTSGGSRPGTGVSTGTNPLMHNARLKLNERRFVGEEQALTWEKQTKSSLEAIEKQLRRTEQQTERDLQEMKRYLHKAEKVLSRQKEIEERRQQSEQVPEEIEAEELLMLRPLQRSPSPILESPPPSRSGRRLREAVEVSRENVEEDDGRVLPDAQQEDACTPSGAPLRLSPARGGGGVGPVPPAFDEEVLDTAGQQWSPEDTEAEESAAEVEEEDVATGVSEVEDSRASARGSRDLRVAKRAGVRRLRRAPAEGGYAGGNTGGYAGARSGPSPGGSGGSGPGRPPRAPHSR